MNNYNKITRPDSEVGSSMKFKRILFNIGWAILNIAMLTWVSSHLIGTTWEIPWLIAVLAYMSFYWILTEILFDLLRPGELSNR